MKYVIEELKDGSFYVASGFDRELHVNIARDAKLNFKRIHSAGYYRMDEDGVVETYGSSIGLNLKPKIEDALIIREAIRNGQII